MALTKAKVASLRKRLVSHEVRDGRAVVEITARELQQLLEAAIHSAPEYESVHTPVPHEDSPTHLYSVTLIIEAGASENPDRVADIVASACIGNVIRPVPVVVGYGVKVTNITMSNLSKRSATSRYTGMVPIGFANRPIPRRLKEIPIIRRKVSL